MINFQCFPPLKNPCLLCIFSVMRHPDVVEEGSVHLETRSQPTMMVFH